QPVDNREAAVMEITISSPRYMRVISTPVKAARARQSACRAANGTLRLVGVFFPAPAVPRRPNRRQKAGRRWTARHSSGNCPRLKITEAPRQKSRSKDAAFESADGSSRKMQGNLRVAPWQT